MRKWLLIALTLVGTPAGAACFEQIGCTDGNYMPVNQLRRLSCENLWHVRNTIYAEHGYCFKTARGQAAFRGWACYVNNENALRFSRFEQANIDAIVQVERGKGC